MDKTLTPYMQDLTNVQIPDLTPIKGANILITGATGLIGSALTDLLMIYAERYNLTIFAGCRSKQSFNTRFVDYSNCLHFLELDVTEPVDSDIPFDYIIHAASGANPTEFATNPVGVMKANFSGVCNLLDYGIGHGLKRFLYVSSGESYGEGCSGKWKENDSGYVDPMTMRACYPSSKRASETLCVAYSSKYGIDTMVARLSHVYGPCFTNKDNRVYAQFIRNVLNKENIVLKSKGEQFRSWLYVVDCAAAMLYILLNGKSQEAYNIANEESNITIRQLAEIIAAISGRRVTFDMPSDIEKAGVTPLTKAVFDTNKLQSLGWEAMTPIEIGLKNTIKTLWH